MMRLQGFRPDRFSMPKISEDEFAKQLGNAMSVNVVERILHQVFQSTNLQHTADVNSGAAIDKWQTGVQFKSLLGSVDPSFTGPRPIGKVHGKVMAGQRIIPA